MVDHEFEGKNGLSLFCEVSDNGELTVMTTTHDCVIFPPDITRELVTWLQDALDTVIESELRKG
jgi:hypothetical protein